MKYRTLGKTALKVSCIGAGCWPMGGETFNLGKGIGWDNVDFDSCLNGLNFGISNGINLVDTANVYGLGRSERIISKVWSKGICDRNKIILIDKTGYYQGCAAHGYHALNMRHQLEMSLSNLETDYIDIYFFHHLDFGPKNIYLDGAINCMHQFKKEGKIRYIGLRGPHFFSGSKKEKNKDHYGSSLNRFKLIYEKINPDVISIRFNMMAVDVLSNENESIFDFVDKHNVGLLGYKSLAQGLLLKKYSPSYPPTFSLFDHRKDKKWFQAKGLSRINNKLISIEKKFGLKSTSDWIKLNLSYVLSKQDISSALVGFKSKKQMQEIICSPDKLTQYEIDFVDEVFKDIYN